jgi:opacity protein-like surface antigen
METKGLYYYFRLCFYVALGLGFAFSTSSCWVFCSECGYGTKNQKIPGTNEEILAQTENRPDQKIGMIRSFDENKIKTEPEATPAIPLVPYKDFSFRLRDDNGCPFGAQSAKSYITAGPNMNFKSAGSDVYAGGSHKAGVGFQAGFGTIYRFNEKWSLNPALMVKVNKASEEATYSDGDPGPTPAPSTTVKDNYTYSYLSMPVLAQYNLTKDLTVSAGPEVNYLLKSKVKSSMNYGGDNHESEEDLTGNSVKVGLGLQAGLKYQIPNSKFALSATYDHRISRLNKKNPEGYGNYTVPAWKMKSVQVGVTCLICDLLKGKKAN